MATHLWQTKAVLTPLQTEDIGNNAMKEYYGLKNLQYVASHLSEWTSDVTNNYKI
jgi:hypothetical protein